MKSTASLKNLQHRNHPCMSLTHCIFHWQPRAARTLLCTAAASHLSSCCSLAAQKGCGCPARDNAWLSPGRRQDRKCLPAPSPRLLHILFLWMTACYNGHRDNLMGSVPWRHSNWSREVADGDVSSKMTMSLKKLMTKCVCPFETFFFLLTWNTLRLLSRRKRRVPTKNSAG